jgi:hypothetical protein
LLDGVCINSFSPYFPHRFPNDFLPLFPAL